MLIEIIKSPYAQTIIGLLVAGLGVSIPATFGLYVSWVKAKQKQLEIAATAAVRIADAHAGPQLDLEGDEKKMIADSAAEELLGAASKKMLAKVPELVQAAWQRGQDRQSAASMRSEALTPAETPTAKRNEG